MNNEINEVEDVLLDTDLLPLLLQEANSKGLNVYVFKKEDFKDIYEVKSEKLGIALLAKNEDCARYNLRNLRRCYLLRFTDNEEENGSN